jgi:predicted DNA-binding protein with PD1-like motif
MKYTEAKQGRIFVIRLEDGDILHEEIEKFAEEKSIKAASVIAVGGADRGSRIIVGPENGRQIPVNPMSHIIEDVHEICGTGTIFPDESGKPVLHMHIACGRRDSALVGCVRDGVKIWHILEIIIMELTDTTAVRKFDNSTGFALLDPS